MLMWPGPAAQSGDGSALNEPRRPRCRPSRSEPPPLHGRRRSGS